MYAGVSSDATELRAMREDFEGKGDELPADDPVADGIWLTWDVLETLSALDRDDRAYQGAIKAQLIAIELLSEHQAEGESDQT